MLRLPELKLYGADADCCSGSLQATGQAMGRADGSSSIVRKQRDERLILDISGLPDILNAITEAG